MKKKKKHEMTITLTRLKYFQKCNPLLLIIAAHFGCCVVAK